MTRRVERKLLRKEVTNTSVGSLLWSSSEEGGREKRREREREREKRREREREKEGEREREKMNY